jgi:hypothetical protein
MKMTSGDVGLPVSVLFGSMQRLKKSMQMLTSNQGDKCRGHFSIAFPTALVYTGDAHPLHQGKLGAIIARIPESLSNSKGATS